MSRATRSALVTPILLGRSSTKKRVMPVSAMAPYVSPRVPKMDDATWVNIVVAVGVRFQIQHSSGDGRVVRDSNSRSVEGGSSTQH